MRFFLVLIISIELIITVFLGYQIYQRQKKVLGVVDINPIKKEAIVFNPSSQLKHFYEPKPNSSETDHSSWLTYKSTYTINDDSLNERFNYNVTKSDDVFRIVTLGDSFTFGLFVDTKDNWTELLEDKLNNLSCKDIKKFEVINLGEYGYDIQYGVERFRLRGQKYNPDLVLWLLKDDDFQQIAEEENVLVEKYADDLKKKDNYSDRDLATSGGKLIIGNIYSQAWNKATNYMNNKFGESQLLAFQTKTLESIYKYLSKRLIIFTLKQALSHPYDQIVENVINKHPGDIFLNDHYSAFDRQKDSFLPFDDHPNQEGHKVITQDLFNYLTKNKIIPCN